MFSILHFCTTARPTFFVVDALNVFHKLENLSTFQYVNARGSLLKGFTSHKGYAALVVPYSFASTREMEMLQEVVRSSQGRLVLHEVKRVIRDEHQHKLSCAATDQAVLRLFSRVDKERFVPAIVSEDRFCDHEVHGLQLDFATSSVDVGNGTVEFFHPHNFHDALEFIVCTRRTRTSASRTKITIR